MTGLEPVASAWKAEVLPLYDIRLHTFRKTARARLVGDTPSSLSFHKILLGFWCRVPTFSERLSILCRDYCSTRPIGIEPMTSGFGNLRSTN